MDTKLFAVGMVFVGAVAAANCGRDIAETPTPEPPPVIVPADVTLPATPAPRPVVSRVSLPPMPTAGIVWKAQKLLSPGTDVTLALHGFKTHQQFMEVAYASRNLNVPFVVLKDKVLTQKMNLTRAIADTTKGVDPALEAQRAAVEARADLARESMPR